MKALLITLTLPLFLCFGCDTDNSEEIDNLSKIEVKEIFSSNNSNIFVENSDSITVKIIKNDENFEEEILSLIYLQYLENPISDVDFLTQKLVFIDLGIKPTDGYSIKAKAVEESEHAISLAIEITSPGNSCNANNKVTRPTLSIALNTEKKILINESLNVTNCE